MFNFNVPRSVLERRLERAIDTNQSDFFLELWVDELLKFDMENPEEQFKLEDVEVPVNLSVRELMKEPYNPISCHKAMPKFVDYCKLEPVSSKSKMSTVESLLVVAMYIGLCYIVIQVYELALQLAYHLF